MVLRTGSDRLAIPRNVLAHSPREQIRIWSSHFPVPAEELHGGRRQGGPGKAFCRGCWEPWFYQVIRRPPSGSGPGGQTSMVLCANQTGDLGN